MSSYEGGGIVPDSLFEPDQYIQIDKGYIPEQGGEGWLRLAIGVALPLLTDSSHRLTETGSDFVVVPIDVEHCAPSHRDRHFNPKSKTFGEVPLHFTGVIIPNEQPDSLYEYGEVVEGYLFQSGHRRGALYPKGLKF